MAEDYLTDDEQLEHVKRVVAENWLWVAGGVVLGAALIFGYRYYEGYVNARALRAAAQFEELTSALARDDQGRVRQVADGLIKQFPTSPYADQAQLMLARLSVDGGKLSDAIAPLTEVMTNSKDAELRHIARLRLARVLTSLGKPDDAIKTLAEDTWGAFGARAHEVRGDAFYAKHDVQAAVKEYQAALGGEAGGADSALLQLKIADLSAPSAAAPPTAESSNKAKP
ncbi:MAG TPA: tetratricopeptide repeat protein [Steroidobacteraceae bacterium]|nr:tetratricopeptide repeat protein [Steroidobacteraceae bacterium]